MLVFDMEAASLRTFFTARKGVEPFFYAPHSMSSTLKWTCSDWGWTAQAPFTFYARLEQSFALDT